MLPSQWPGLHPAGSNLCGRLVASILPVGNSSGQLLIPNHLSLLPLVLLDAVLFYRSEGYLGEPLTLRASG